MSRKECKLTEFTDFEDDEFPLGSWRIFDHWKVASGRDYEGIYDHTNENQDGHFLSAESEDHTGKYSSFYSQSLAPTSDSGVCFTFYFLFQKSIGMELSVTLREYGVPDRVLWKLADNQEQPLKTWNLARVSFKTRDNSRLRVQSRDGPVNDWSSVGELGVDIMALVN